MEKFVGLNKLNKKYKNKNDLKGWFIVFNVFFVVYALSIIFYSIFSYVFIRANVIGISMQPLFNKDVAYSPSNNYDNENKDVVFVNKFDKGKQGDIILIDMKSQTYSGLILKRLIATAGQRVTLKLEIDGLYHYYISDNANDIGQLLIEPYLASEHRQNMKGQYYNAFCESASVTFLNENKTLGAYFVVPDDKVFVLGDNRTYSTDSHNSAIGCRPTSEIMGTTYFYYRHDQNFLSFIWEQFLNSF